MHILVTGGAGYIGSVSVEAFLAAGHEVTVLDDLSTGHRAAIADGARLELGSYADSTAVAKLLESPQIEAVLQLRPKSIASEPMTDPANDCSGNVACVLALLEGMRAADVKRIVFSSTAATY